MRKALLAALLAVVVFTALAAPAAAAGPTLRPGQYGFYLYCPRVGATSLYICKYRLRERVAYDQEALVVTDGLDFTRRVTLFHPKGWAACFWLGPAR